MALAATQRTFRIDVIGHGRAAIGISAAPGGNLDVIKAFRPDAVVTLLSTHELRMMGQGDLPDALSTLTAQWHHVPLRASGAPDARFERLWAYAGHRLRAILRRGGRVHIHCDDSGARARWAAARLLMELGVPPSEAAARTGAALASPPKRMLPDHHLASRILGCVFGGAVGDAVGYPAEFKTRDEIAKTGLLPPRGRLTVSDDTQMTLYTADGLLSGLAVEGVRKPEQILARIRYAYLAWFRTQRDDWSPHAAGFSQHKELWAVRAPGSTCLAALHRGARGTPEKPINDSKGSGGVMRVAPLGLIPAIDAGAAFRLAHAAAALTHGHPSGRLSAAALASLIRDLLGEAPMNVALDRMEARLGDTPGGAETLAAVRRARALAGGATPPAEAVDSLGQGWTGEEALAIGVYAALKADSFEHAIQIAAEHDGDSDTTASLAGQIWGAHYGLDVIPHAWVRQLDVLDAVCDVGARMAAQAAAPGETTAAPRLLRASA